MPERKATILQGAPVFSEENHGAHYYAYSPEVSKSGARYTKATATIILPPVQSNGNPGVKNHPNANSGASYAQRNAYISLGVGGTEGGTGVDLGIGNSGDGSGWKPAYFDTTTQKGKWFDSYEAKSHATKAAIAIMPLSKKQVKFYVQFMDANGGSAGKTFEQIISVGDRGEAWSRFYRFASLVQNPNEALDVLRDSTYMINGQFTDLKITKSNGVVENWGITTDNVDDAWIMSHPKCQVLTKGSTYESFSIDHWA